MAEAAVRGPALLSLSVPLLPALGDRQRSWSPWACQTVGAPQAWWTGALGLPVSLATLPNSVLGPGLSPAGLDPWLLTSCGWSWEIQGEEERLIPGIPQTRFSLDWPLSQGPQGAEGGSWLSG